MSESYYLVNADEERFIASIKNFLRNPKWDGGAMASFFATQRGTMSEDSQMEVCDAFEREWNETIKLYIDKDPEEPRIGFYSDYSERFVFDDIVCRGITISSYKELFRLLSEHEEFQIRTDGGDAIDWETFVEKTAGTKMLQQIQQKMKE